MLKFIKNLFKTNNENSKRFRRDMAKKIDGKKLKYVTERIDEEESVIGREGALICKEDELLVYSSSNVVFRARIDELLMNELLSMEGIILTGSDLEHGGVHRSIIAYYTYYRKVD